MQHRGRENATDGLGRKYDFNCDIFCTDELYWFLSKSLENFNLTPKFTNLSFANPVCIDIYQDILVEGAYVLALINKQLIENGRPFYLSEINFSKASGYFGAIGIYSEKLKIIKTNLL